MTNHLAGDIMKSTILILTAILLTPGGPLAAQAQSSRKAKPAAKAKPATPGAPFATDVDFDAFESPETRGQPAKPAWDPLRGYNRAMFAVNDKFYFWMAKPAAMFYGFFAPEPVRVSIGRAYDNLYFPIRFVNSGFQGKFAGAGRELGRFTLNTTIGIGGLFDPAWAWFKLKPSEEDFGQTFGFYGIGAGPPLVLPLLGQNNLRDTVGMGPNFLLNPVYYLADQWVYFGVSSGYYFNYLSLHIGDYEKLKKDSLDPYTFIRDAHLQNREKKVQE